MDNKMIICCGVSGSGKSTFAKKLCKEDNYFLRINRDDIRKVLVGDLDKYYQRKDLKYIESIVTYTEICLFTEYTIYNKNIVIDNTNLNKKYINYWIELASEYEYEVEFKFFDISLEEAKQRVFERDFWNTANNLDKVKYIEKQFEQYRQIKKEYESKDIK